ncbi:DUF6000 family protein [Kitasatospora sp. DSM 101779]|uniref:DUF6000 family protein n=1 Tax=Kitasatospora sp. DSM 101779 TaxID=2853165 RepID=UPI0021D866DA|nr:DUF6000 family protein [Kitasatospora sp. DSM 101779]MCU7826568.1 hypothetical protein [Kitasatospora sp. DSM 101779]
MRRTHDDPELRELVQRYVTPDRRYRRLGGSLLRLDDAEHARFAQEIGRAAGEITTRQLGVLLDGGWRERKTEAWLIAVSRRTEFRDRLGGLLLASEAAYAGAAYCTALATFATEADADLLVAYLERYLRRTDLSYDQAFVLGALLHMDGESGRDRAAHFLAPGGPWQQWCAGPPARAQDPQVFCQVVGRLCAFALSATQSMVHESRGQSRR